MLLPPDDVPREPAHESPDSPVASAFIPPDAVYRRASWDFRAPVLGDYLGVNVMRRLADGVQAATELTMMAEDLGITASPHRPERLDVLLSRVKERFWHGSGAAEADHVFALIQVGLADASGPANVALAGIDLGTKAVVCARCIRTRINGSVAQDVLDSVRNAVDWLATIAADSTDPGTAAPEREPSASSPQVLDASQGTTHAEDFTIVRWFGTEYVFHKGQQAAVVRVLWSEWEKGGLGLSEDVIRDRIGNRAARFRVAHVFRLRGRARGKKMHRAWGTMIQSIGKAVYKLAPPQPPKNHQ